MARLYPPNISGVIPSFYNKNGTVILTVPFSLNKSVSRSEICGFRLKLKYTSSDTMVGDIVNSCRTVSADIEELKIQFELPSEIVSQLTIGDSYKVQVAHVDSTGITGYYSTVGITKYTGVPAIRILKLKKSVGNVARSCYTGKYQNEDTSEKVYQYRFLLYKNSEIVKDTGWKIHSSYEDSEDTNSVDIYNIDATEYDQIQYKVITGGGLELSSPIYSISSSFIDSSLLNGSLEMYLDAENGYIQLNGDFTDINNIKTNLNYVICRKTVSNIKSENLKLFNGVINSSSKSFSLKDKTIENGMTYKYVLYQQFEDGSQSKEKAFSLKDSSDTKEIKAYFDYTYLYDGEKNLCIRFNSNISSFKNIVSEAKKDTIGSKYPYFFKNNNTHYKEFQLTGLISYLMDENQDFVKREDLDFPTNFVNTTDRSYENIAAEKNFKLQVLEWLNNGEVKLFRSPQEGNYLVRLTNVSMTPQNNLARMIHNFSCTADEVAEINQENLESYSIIDFSSDLENNSSYQVCAQTIVLGEKLTDPDTYSTTNLLPAGLKEIKKITFEGAKNLQYNYGNSDQNFIICQDNIEIEFTLPISSLYVSNMSDTFEETKITITGLKEISADSSISLLDVTSAVIDYPIYQVENTSNEDVSLVSLLKEFFYMDRYEINDKANIIARFRLKDTSQSGSVKFGDEGVEIKSYTNLTKTEFESIKIDSNIKAELSFQMNYTKGDTPSDETLANKISAYEKAKYDLIISKFGYEKLSDENDTRKYITAATSNNTYNYNVYYWNGDFLTQINDEEREDYHNSKINSEYFCIVNLDKKEYINIGELTSFESGVVYYILGAGENPQYIKVETSEPVKGTNYYTMMSGLQKIYEKALNAING